MHVGSAHCDITPPQMMMGCGDVGVGALEEKTDLCSD